MNPLALTAMVLLLIQQPAGTSISGRISFADGTAAAGIPVTLLMAPGQERAGVSVRGATTAEDGKFQLQNAPAGRYTIRIRLGSNLEPYYPSASLDVSSATVITLAAGSKLENIDLVLPPSMSGVFVEGRVRYPAGQEPSAADRHVDLGELGFRPRPGKPIDADGSFRFEHVFPGAYTLRVPAPGFRPMNLKVSNIDATGIVLDPPKLTPVTTRIAMDGDASHPSLALRFDGTTYQTTTSTSSGPEISAKLPPGSYRLIAMGLPRGYYIRSLTAGNADLLQTSLKVAGNETAPLLTTVTLGFSPPVKIAGHIVSAESGEPQSTAGKLLLLGAATDETVQTSVEKDGSFELGNVMPGTYMARVTLSSTLTSPPAAFVIPNKNAADLKIAIPEPRELSGRVLVDGNGPPPQFTLLLQRGSDISLSDANPSSIAALARRAEPGNQVLQLKVNALPDGTFKVRIPLGDYSVSQPAASAIPAAYVLRSLTFGAADLLKEPLHISDDQSAELSIGFGTATANPWVRVRGHVRGFDPAQGLLRVSLESNITSPIEEPVYPDGTFDFPAVLPQNNYTAKLVPPNDAARTPRISVIDKDVDGIEIVVPGEREISGSITMDGTGAIPGFLVTLATANTGSVTKVVKPERNGTFHLKVPTDERQFRVSGLPMGYTVKSATYGEKDLLKEPLIAAEAAELRISLAMDAELGTGSISGLVVGLDPNHGPIQIALNGVASFAVFEAEVGADGGFKFSDIPQGAYALSLGGAISALPMPSSIVMGDHDVDGLEVTATRQSTAQGNRQVPEPPSGASISDLGGGGPEAANESAAVAGLRTINTAEITFLAANHGKFTTVVGLIGANLLGKQFLAPVSGFAYSIIALGANFAVAAVPVSPDAGRYAFYSTPDGVIRYSAADFLAPPGLAGNPVQ